MLLPFCIQQPLNTTRFNGGIQVNLVTVGVPTACGILALVFLMQTDFGKSYIAAQECTPVEFWRMVWEENCRVILTIEDSEGEVCQLSVY
jgi:hypothetical protein